MNQLLDPCHYFSRFKIKMRSQTEGMKCAILALLILFTVTTAETHVSLLYSVKTGGAIWGTPAFFRGKLFFASYDRNVYAVDANNGGKIWTALAENSIRGSLCVDTTMNGVVAATLSGSITMRDADTGRILWSQQRKSFTWTFSPVCVAGHTFVPMRNDDLVVYSSQNGEEKISLKSSSGVWSAPLVLQNASTPDKVQVIVAITADASVSSAFLQLEGPSTVLSESRWKYDVVPGATHYKQKLHAWIFGSPCVCMRKEGSVVVFGSNDKVVRAVDSITGKLVWTSRVGGKVSSTPVSVRGSVTHPVVVATEGGDVVGLSEVDGTVLWKLSLHQPIGSIVGPSTLGSIVVVGGLRGRVVGIDGVSGSLLFQTDIPQCSVRANPGLRLEVSALLVAIGCENGALNVFKVENIGAALVAPVVEIPIKPSVLRDVNHALTHESWRDVDTTTPPTPHFTFTSILIAAVLCSLCGYMLLLRRNQLHKEKF
jgi:outer membrane protein assembly factor BamB